ncbi:MAG: GH3 auxin-responsive promoter family protein, partial [Bdellovibrionales bacterium]|nr:GH3 auxin-responsive promoter family protein [Bdellovibrionales bacterium]
MLKKFAQTTLQTAYAATLIQPRHKFLQRLKAPEKASELRLRDIVNRNTECEFGRRHGFDQIRSIADFQSRVPIRSFDEYSPLIDRAARGYQKVLTAEDIRYFERTYGSFSSPKLIPYTSSLLGEIESVTAAWLGDLIFRNPALIGTKTYWASSPPSLMQQAPVTAGGIPIGATDLLGYFNQTRREFLKTFLIRPSISTSDVRAWRIETAAALLETKNLGFVSVWSPSFLFPILETIARSWEDVIPLVRNRERRIELDRLRDAVNPLENPRSFITHAWPKLQIVSAWADGPSSDLANRLEALIPSHTELESKGLSAVEGMVTVPFSGSNDPVIAVGGHFLEFLDLNRPKAAALLPHELKVGGLYSPVLTTSGGLYRYHLRDVLYCSGRNHLTPTMTYRGRLDKSSSLVGEHLEAAQVVRSLEIASNMVGFRPDFFL